MIKIKKKSFKNQKKKNIKIIKKKAKKNYNFFNPKNPIPPSIPV